jgi:soluble lytic murein transglycosylase
VAERIAALDDARRFGDALALREALAEADPPTTDAARRTLARARFRGRDYPGAVALYRTLHGPPEAATGGPSDLFQDALATSRTGDYDTAAVLYGRLLARHPGHARADTAHFKLGYLEVDRGNHAAARPLLRAHLEERPGSRHHDEARWWLGWGHYVEGDTDAAVAAWASLLARHPDSTLAPGARYWTARSRGRQGDAEAERAGLEAVLKRHPTSGHAWFAAHRLGTPFPARQRLERPPLPETLARDPAVAAFEQLLALGLQDEARAVLTAALPRLRGRGRQADLALAWALIAAGAYREGQALARPCAAPWAAGDPLVQQACWPRPARTVVQAQAARWDLPELVAYGIMRTESALDPSVTSLAGARGLMQLMPDEAAGIHATVYGDRPYHPDLLYSAPYNASLGVAELGEKSAALGDLLEGPDLVAAIAAYNGGEAAARRWAEGLGGHPDFDVFAESIGYTETRRYVRKVLGTVMAYRHVYGDAAASD